MLQKIYIHHYFSNILFHKLAHNTTDRIYNIDSNNVGTILCKYKGLDFEFEFNPIIHNKKDGYHLLDYFTAYFQRHDNKDYNDVNIIGLVEDTPFLKKFAELTLNKSDWLITFFRTEKILAKHDTTDDWWIGDVETKIKALSKHKIISDNFFLNEDIRYFYPNVFFAFTNTLWQWNEIISIRWYYEYNEVFNKLNFDYDLMYSVRHHKKHRVEILKELSNLNNSKILLQRTDSMKNSLFEKYNNGLNDYTNIHLNKMVGDDDFSNLKLIEYSKGINWDIFFRLLSKAKMQVLDESWAWDASPFHSQYLSEKTYGLVLAGIPFISTHSYPVEMLQKILNIPPHPFLDEFKLHKGDSKLFAKFVNKFMENFDDNYILCKNWMDVCRNEFMKKIDNENSLLDLVMDNFLNESVIIKNKFKLL